VPRCETGGVGEAPVGLQQRSSRSGRRSERTGSGVCCCAAAFATGLGLGLGGGLTGTRGSCQQGRIGGAQAEGRCSRWDAEGRSEEEHGGCETAGARELLYPPSSRPPGAHGRPSQARLRHKIAAYVPGGRPLLADPAGVAAFQQDSSPHIHQLCRQLACTFARSPPILRPASLASVRPAQTVQCSVSNRQHWPADEDGRRLSGT
jgi:hypothetical protein